MAIETAVWEGGENRSQTSYQKVWVDTKILVKKRLRIDRCIIRFKRCWFKWYICQTRKFSVIFIQKFVGLRKNHLHDGAWVQYSGRIQEVMPASIETILLSCKDVHITFQELFTELKSVQKCRRYRLLNNAEKVVWAPGGLSNVTSALRAVVSPKVCCRFEICKEPQIGNVMVVVRGGNRFDCRWNDRLRWLWNRSQTSSRTEFPSVFSDVKGRASSLFVGLFWFWKRLQKGNFHVLLGW